METIKCLEIEFDKKAKLVNETQWVMVEKELDTQKYTDVIVLAHGWNNDMADARRLYGKLIELIEKEFENHDIIDKNFLAIEVLWPSKKFADNDLIPGGSASLDDQSKQHLEVDIKLLNDLLDSPGKKIMKEISNAIKMDSTDEISSNFVKLFKHLQKTSEQPEILDSIPTLQSEKIDMMLTDSLFFTETKESEGMGGVVGVVVSEEKEDQVQALGLFSGIVSGIQNLLNVTTYYKMKERAGVIGAKGLNPVLRKVKKGRDHLHLHLIGHSFGARLVSSALMGNNEDEEVEVESLILLQAAFSHYAFAKKYDKKNDGFFRSVVNHKLVKNSFLITHTRLDKAVGLAYAIASRMAGHQNSAIGGTNDPFGGLGGNGAQSTPEAKFDSLLNSSGIYSFEVGKIYNLKSDDYIGGHSDILKPEVAKLIVAAFDN